MRFEPDARFGPYRIVRKLGEGGMGTVWEGVHEGLEKRVAIKTLNPALATQPEAVARFVREGRAAARIHHAHVVSVTDVGVYEDAPVLVMELLEGESLAARIAREGALDVATLIDLALPVLDALAAAHAEGVVHRDLKPENIFLRKTRRLGMHPVVLDFGISKLEGADARLTHTASFIGTPNYMSPEQARGAKNADARSDQYSLGLVLFEAASGRRAVEGDSVFEIAHKLATGDVPTLEQVRPGLPEALYAVVDRMMAPKAADRFASLTDAGAALLPLASARTVAMWSGAFGAGGEAGAEPRADETAERAPSRKSETTKPVATPSTIESAAPARAPAGRAPRLALGVIAIAIGVGAVAIAVGSRTPPVSSPAPRSPVAITGAPARAAAAPAAEPEQAPALARGVDVPSLSAEDEAALALSGVGDDGAEDGADDDTAGADTPAAARPIARAASPAPSTAARPPSSSAHAEAPPPPPTTTTAALGHGTPATPSRAAIRTTMERVAPVARACGRIVHGDVTLSFTVAGPTGRISDVAVELAHPSPALTQCLTRALSAAQFPRFTQPTFRVRYPITI